MHRGIHCSKDGCFYLVYGNLFEDNETGKCYIMFGNVRKPEVYEVFPDTIGECTEVRDKDGIYIYEGDCLAMVGVDGVDSKAQQGLAVTFADGAFFWNGYPISDYLSDPGSDSHNLKIVGRVYDPLFENVPGYSEMKMIGAIE